jgi:hypothetical protein
MKVIVNAAVKLGNKFDSEENRVQFCCFFVAV